MAIYKGWYEEQKFQVQISTLHRGDCAGLYYCYFAHTLFSEQCSMSISFLLLLHSFCFRLALLAAKKPCWIGRIAKKLLSGRLCFWGWSQNQELKFSLVALFSTWFACYYSYCFNLSLNINISKRVSRAPKAVRKNIRQGLRLTLETFKSKWVGEPDYKTLTNKTALPSQEMPVRFDSIALFVNKETAELSRLNMKWRGTSIIQNEM